MPIGPARRRSLLILATESLVTRRIPANNAEVVYWINNILDDKGGSAAAENPDRCW